MVRLDIEAINHAAPYQITKRTENVLHFRTDAGLRYDVRFDTDLMLQSSMAYQFSIVRLDRKPSPRDQKLRDTVVAIIQEFFRSNQATMLYICETDDGRQDMRNRLFSHWFKTFANEEEYIYRHAEVEAEEVMNYITMILRKDNPDAEKVLEEWDSTLFMLSEKPES